MTANELIRKSGMKFSRSQKSRIGEIFLKKAKELNVKPQKVFEQILVNDYPESFVETMEQELINWVSTKK